MEQENEEATRKRSDDQQIRSKRKAMAHRRTSGSKLLMTVLYMVASCSAVPISDLLDRASQGSDKLHSLSTTLTQVLDSHFPPIGRVITPRPSTCHTSSLHTPNDKAQALQVSMGPAAQAISALPYRGGNDIGQDKISKLINFHFLMSCFRRDSHKIDSFLKVLRCRAAKMQPEMC
ncbi:prolactin-like protein [Lates japonicus]|uniref:Prolactin-like protein n=1 Tax=Lates japonicus TaxID=270547 RepID=A0AAD3RAL1_LATJO|nr:prolactin-like protein [Lates japonicus]